MVHDIECHIWIRGFFRSRQTQSLVVPWGLSKIYRFFMLRDFSGPEDAETRSIDADALLSSKGIAVTLVAYFDQSMTF